MFLQSAEKLANDLCFPLTKRSNFSRQEFSFTVDDSYVLWCKLRSVIDSFNGDAETFYSLFVHYIFIENHLPSKFNDRSLMDTLLLEVANEMLNVIGTHEKRNRDIPENEIKRVQYLTRLWSTNFAQNFDFRGILPVFLTICVASFYMHAKLKMILLKLFFML